MSERHRPRFLPVLLTLAVSFVLSIGAFYGCDRTLVSGNSSRLNTFFLWSFMVFSACFAGAAGWLVVAVLLNVIRKKWERQ